MLMFAAFLPEAPGHNPNGDCTLLIT